ncbi:MAG: aminotransferase class III-fold pyridoxal phosphate-dependent enzyme, partial [Saprospiraceae bacterium]
MHIFDVYSIQQINITKAKGSYVWDETGQKYLDMYGGHAVISIGHLHDHWQKALKDQLDKIAFYSNSIIIRLQ